METFKALDHLFTFRSGLSFARNAALQRSASELNGQAQNLAFVQCPNTKIKQKYSTDTYRQGTTRIILTLPTASSPHSFALTFSEDQALYFSFSWPSQTHLSHSGDPGKEGHKHLQTRLTTLLPIPLLQGGPSIPSDATRAGTHHD